MMAAKFEETRVYRETREEGREEGKEATQVAIAIKMIQRNLDLEMIAEVTGLPIEQLQKPQADNQS